MIPKCTTTLGVAFMRELRMFRALVGKANKHQIGPEDTIRKVLKCRCLKCLCIVRLDLIYMSYDQKKGGNQIPNLTLDHKTLKNKGQMKFNWGVLYVVGKIFLKSIRYCCCILKTYLI
jgi:hypothetical protein